jgi:hypothetical protein
VAAAAKSELETARQHALAYLRAQAVSGWFAYKPHARPSIEATAWAALALRKEPSVAEAAARFLVSAQNKDGGWSTEPGAGRSDWNSGPAMLCLRVLASEHKQIADDGNVKRVIKSGLSHLLDSRTEFFKPVARLLMIAVRGPNALAYARGWPWYPDCFHWLEPTAYGLLALKFPFRPEHELYEHVIEFANRFLLEHSCKGGGWNHGNDESLGSFLPPYRLTTAEGLLALQDCRTDKAVQDALKYLQSQSGQNSSSLSLATSILALLAYDQKAEQETAFLLTRQAADGSFNNATVATAIAALALEATLEPGGHVLRKEHSKQVK